MSRIQIQCNGSPYEVGAGATVLDVLAARNIDPAHVVVEHNRVILRPAELPGTIVHQDDSLEILHFVGGG